jgi:hypothetical protein
VGRGAPFLTPVPRRVLARFEGLEVGQPGPAPRAAPPAVALLGERVEVRSLAVYAEYGQ